MAQAIICDVCQSQTAAFLVTNMADGATFAGCGPDFVEWCRAMTTAVDGATGNSEPGGEPPGAPESEGEADNGTPGETPPKSEPEAQPETEQQQQPSEDSAPATAND